MSKVIHAEDRFPRKKNPGSQPGKPDPFGCRGDETPIAQLRSKGPRWGSSLVESVLRAAERKAKGGNRTSAEIDEQDEKSALLRLRARKLMRQRDGEDGGPDVA